MSETENKRCPNGTRLNKKTKKCEPKKPKKYTFKRGEGRGQVELARNAHPISEVITNAFTNFSPATIKKFDDTNATENVFTSIHPASIIEPKPVVDIKVGQQHTINIIDKKIPLNNSIRTADEISTKLPVTDLYKKMTVQELRDRWAILKHLPTGKKTSGKFIKKSDLIDEIIRLEQQEKEEKGSILREPPLIIPTQPFIIKQNDEKEDVSTKTVVIQPTEKEIEPEVNPPINLIEQQQQIEEEKEKGEKGEKGEKEEKEKEEEGEEGEGEKENINNTELLEKEKQEFTSANNDTTYDFLYPNLNDPNFNIKIAKKKEFNDTKYDGTIHDIKQQAETLCNSDFELMPHQLFVKNFLSFQTPYNSLLLYNSLGTGKCHKKDTPILMSDGSIKMVQDIQTGELLMGDDSKPRKVLSLSSGIDKMYDVISKNGEKYTVNSEHILCLRRQGDKENAVYEIAIKDYLLLPKSTKKQLKGYKVSVEFPEKEVPVDAYTFGLQNGYQNIPPEYKCNSRENRLKLLSGILDKDKKESKLFVLQNQNININQKDIKNARKEQIDDLLFLVRSLGISIKYTGTKGLTLESQIKDEDKNTLLTDIKVKYVNQDEYYGFTLNGNCRYLLGDFTVTHNTCSAIGIAEEMRSYMKQIGISKKIMVVASPNVQANFRMQLFDEQNLNEENGLWNLNTCVGDSLLKEMNPTNLKGISKEKIVSQIKSIINSYYLFLGYTELANFITKKTIVSEESGLSEKEKRILEKKKIRKVFDNNLIIIDEVHNLRMTDDNKNKRTATLLMKVAKYSNNLRLLLLSATPMYNSYKEIIWLLKLININDNRAIINEDDVFDKEGNFIVGDETKEGGRELLQRKLTGYVSYVRGENPYTFPYRIYPTVFSPENTISKDTYPKLQMNKKEISEPIQHVPVYVNRIGEYQHRGYNFIMENMRKRSFNKSNNYGDETIMPTFENMERFGYTLLQVPLESLNIVYPNEQFDDFVIQVQNEEKPYNAEEYNEMIANIVGKKGLSNIMNYDTVLSPQPMRFNFDYKPDVLEKYGKLFARENIGKYSSKISKFCDCVLQSKGILIIYSQYIDGGCVPIALALEELGFARYGSESFTKSLLKNPPEPIDALTMKPQSQTSTVKFKQAKYVMITGDPSFSPNNANDIKYITRNENKHGELVKVIIISKAASEGLDFKNIRQIHIIEPWYNMNRIEQIIGRGVRNLSHCGLPFEDRNVEIYLHSTLPINEEEPADLYVYRLAEKKALQIGKVTRVLKESAVDCLLNIGQMNFTVDKMMALIENKNIKINLSSKSEPVDFQFGDKDFTDVCDYMECQKDFRCSPHAEINDTDINKDTYGEDYVKMNYTTILKRIRQLYREQNVYNVKQLFENINRVKQYPEEQIYYCLSQIIDNKNEYLIDKYGRRGYLINRDEYYAFQPVEITDENASLYERTVPVDYKRESILLELPKTNVQEMKYENLTNTTNTTNVTNTTINEHEVREPLQLENIRSYEIIFAELKKTMDIALNNKTIETGDTDWYIHVSQVFRILREVHSIPLENIIKYVIYHYLDCLPFYDRLVIINHLYSIDYNREQEENVISILRGYFEDKIVENTRIKKKAILLTDVLHVKLFILNEGHWVEARTVDKDKFKEQIDIRMMIQKDSINNFVGFMSVFKNQYMTFKTKDLSQRRNNKGALCSNASKMDIIKRLNFVLDDKKEKNMYTIQNTENILKIGLCAILEMILRYYTDTNDQRENKVYFIDSEKALINNISSF